MTQNYPHEGFLVWYIDEEDKVVLPYMEDIIKGILGFIQYWDHLRVVDVGGSFCH
jgi:hypothetical protein